MNFSVAMPTTLFDADEIRRMWQLFIDGDSITEVRLLDASLRGEKFETTYSGYFNDVEPLIHELGKFGKWLGVYFIFNEVNPALLARSANRLRKVKKGETTSDNDILRRRFVPIDCDPVRPAGISSTDAEHDLAIELLRRIVDFLAQNGWPEAIIADSGNGGHAEFATDLEADSTLVERFLEALDKKFGDDVVKIDKAVATKARIWKLYPMGVRERIPWRVSA